MINNNTNFIIYQSNYDDTLAKTGSKMNEMNIIIADWQ